MKDKRKKRLGTALMLGGLLLLASALSLYLYNVWDSWRAGQAAGQVLEQLNEAIPEPEMDTDNGDEESDDLPLYLLEPDMEMPTVEIDGRRYIGRIDIPGLELSLPVLEEWSYPNLKIGPCRYAGTAYQDDFVLAAHNYGSHFGRIKTLQIGEELTFTDADGNVFRYRVAEVEVLQPTAIEEMTSGGWALSLFTCTVGGEYRVTVRCVRADGF